MKVNIKELKEQYAVVHEITAKSDKGEDLTGYYRSPNKKEFRVFATILDNKNLWEASEFCLKELWIGGVKLAELDGQPYAQSVIAVQSIVNLPSASIVKL